MSRSPTPLLWLLFSAGGTLAAFFFPIYLLLFGLVFPLGGAEPPSHERLLELLQHPLTRVALFFFISLPLFHWAHRFRYTLYDGLMLKHLNMLIAVLCYGTAAAAAAATAWTLLAVP